MKNLKTILLLLLIIVLTTGSVAFASDKADKANKTDKDGIVLEPGYFRPNLTFKAHYAVSGIATGDVNFKDDVGIGNKNVPEYRLWLNDTLRIAYTRWDLSGSKTLTSDISYGGSTYPAGSTASAYLKTDYYRVTWLHHITKSPVLKTDWLIDLKGFNIKTAISGRDNTGTDRTQSKSFTGVIPTIGFRAETKPEGDSGLGFFGEVSGLPLGKYGHFYDAEAGVKYYINKQASVTVAYRAFDLTAKDGKADGDKVEFRQSGPFFELAYKF